MDDKVFNKIMDKAIQIGARQEKRQKRELDLKHKEFALHKKESELIVRSLEQKIAFTNEGISLLREIKSIMRKLIPAPSAVQSLKFYLPTAVKAFSGKNGFDKVKAPDREVVCGRKHIAKSGSP